MLQRFTNMGSSVNTTIVHNWINYTQLLYGTNHIFNKEKKSINFRYNISPVHCITYGCSLASGYIWQKPHRLGTELGTSGGFYSRVTWCEQRTDQVGSILVPSVYTFLTQCSYKCKHRNTTTNNEHHQARYTTSRTMIGNHNVPTCYFKLFVIF
jgi:hypothetical protein